MVRAVLCWMAASIAVVLAQSAINGVPRNADDEILRLNRELRQSSTNPSRIAALHNRLAIIHQNRGDFGQAEQHYRRAIRELSPVDRKQLDLLALVLNNLGALYYDAGRLRESLSIRHQALAARVRVSGSESAGVAQALHNLATSYYGLGQNLTAEALYRRAIEIWEAANQPEDELLSLNGVALLKIRNHDCAGAVALLEKAIRRWDATKTHDDAILVATLTNLGAAYAESKAFESAEPMFESSLFISESKFGRLHFITGRVAQIYSEALRKFGFKRRSDELKQRATEIFHSVEKLGQTVDLRDFAGFQ